MPGIELLRTRTLAWTDRELLLASRADGRILARWPLRPDESDSDSGGRVENAAISWATLAHPERLAIELGTVASDDGEWLVEESSLAILDPETGAVERRTRVFFESHALCGWTPDGTQLYVSGMRRYVPRPPPAPSVDPAAALRAAIESPPSAAPVDHGPGLLALDAATGAVVGALPFDTLPHCDRLVFRPDGRVALSRSTSQYRSHFARLDIESARVPFEDGTRRTEPPPRIDGATLRVGFAAPIETWRVHPLPGFREAIVVESGYAGPRVVANWNLETGARDRVVFEIPEAELLDTTLASPSGVLDAWPAGEHVVIARGNGEICLEPGGRVLPLRCTAAERLALAGSTLYVAREQVVDALRLDEGDAGDPAVVVADAGGRILALAADGAAGELIALTEAGSLRAFRIPRSAG